MIDEFNIFKNKYWLNQEDYIFELFSYQRARCSIYHRYLSLIGYAELPGSLDEIPLMPIGFFKNQLIQTEDFTPEVRFKSSGTGDVGRSSHVVREVMFYNQVTENIFTQFLGDPRSYCHLALLPSYLEQQHSSLVHMVGHFIDISSGYKSAFFLYDHQQLYETLLINQQNQVPSILWGVSYALLDFFETFALTYKDLIIIETGGMKGRRKEMIRTELHHELRARSQAAICSEYGMTELLSQAYYRDGYFRSNQSLIIVGKEMNDPFTTSQEAKTCQIGIIDKANIHSCAFILTEDIGRVYADGRFEVLGRMDNSDIRGCNLMVGDLS